MAQNINDSDKDDTRMDLPPHAVTSAEITGIHNRPHPGISPF